MKIIYEEREEAYFVELSAAESVTIINTGDIVEARKYFLDCMTRLFNDAVNKQLKA